MYQDFKQIALLLIYILSSCTQEQKHTYKNSDFRPALEKHLNKIVAAGALSNSPDTLTRNFLRDSCTKEEVLNLLSCPNPLIKVTAYRAIINRNEPDYFSILKNHLDDTAKVEWWYFDDAADNFMVSDLMIRKAVEAKKLSREQKDAIVDLVLLKHPNLETTNWMIQDISPNEKYYSLIRKKTTTTTTKCGEQMGASYALSKFRKLEDTSLLKNNFIRSNNSCTDWSFRAIENFPDTTFYSFLNNYFNLHIKKTEQSGYDDLKYFCRAVAIYKNESSLKILTALTNKQTYHNGWYLSQNKENVFRAIHKYKCPIYNNLYKKLKPQIADYVLKELNTPNYSNPFERTTW
jgi:hypothetical protein